MMENKTQYHCKNSSRRQQVSRHPSLNGIDFLEVLDRDAPAGSPRQQTLLVYALKPLPVLNASNVIIDGGERIPQVAVRWAYRVSDIPPALLTAGEQTFFAELSDPDKIFALRTEAAGDFSFYQLRLVQSQQNPVPPPDFDPLLSSIEFSFKVECPTDFDCRPGDECPPESGVNPPISYLARDFASFRRLMLDRLSTIMPDWKERNPADLGVAIVEVLAYAGDYLSYYQDAVATEAYLGTARQRSSVRRHARLLDYRMHEGCNARGWIALEVDVVGDGQRLPTRDPATRTYTRFLTRVGENPLILPEDLPEILQDRQPLVFEPLHEQVLYTAHNRLSFYTWGEEQCCLPRGATRATFRDNPIDRLKLRAGDVLILEESINPATGEAAEANPAHRQAVRLIRVNPEAQLESDGNRMPAPLLTDPLTGEAIVEVEWHPADALTFPLCISKVLGDNLITDMAHACGNVLLADHGITLTEQPLMPDTVPDRDRFRPRLTQDNLTYRESYDHLLALGKPAQRAVVQAPNRALPAIRLQEGNRVWLPQQDLLNSGRFSLEFVVEPEENRPPGLRFGDDVLGKRPLPGSSFRATLRVGNGEPGNVGADTIAHVSGSGLRGIIRVRNPLPFSGGANPESIAQVRQNAPYAFHRQERAVREEDYAQVCERHPEVQKAQATFRWTGSWHTVFITVDRRGGLPVDAEFETELRTFLEKFRMAGHDVEIEPPRFVSLDIAFTVCVDSNYFASQVKAELLKIFSSRVLADGRRGFFHPDNFTFGQPVYLSQMIAHIMHTPGVLWVDADQTPPKPNRFRRWGLPDAGELAKGYIPMGRLEIVRLENDPNFPENGRLQFFMEGGR